MANAHPTVREAADHVAPANDDDGVAQVIESLLDSRVGPRQD
jgi:hydroxymethylpyrimidine pyrophosphatase-like HAD family hydrolase